ncbi:uncharacterized protein [Gossypium hirsutum]|uniref:Uncharacterized protein n=1 Tax=Gossypium hirsutum TaxID=3635 RepID=A0ABM3BJD6_GOSHI|nr:uncharacterized protein LOC121228095 [Gossypium hirsutum]
MESVRRQEELGERIRNCKNQRELDSLIQETCNMEFGFQIQDDIKEYIFDDEDYEDEYDHDELIKMEKDKIKIEEISDDKKYLDAPLSKTEQGESSNSKVKYEDEEGINLKDEEFSDDEVNEYFDPSLDPLKDGIENIDKDGLSRLEIRKSSKRRGTSGYYHSYDSKYKTKISPQYQLSHSENAYNNRWLNLDCTLDKTKELDGWYRQMSFLSLKNIETVADLEPFLEHFMTGNVRAWWNSERGEDENLMILETDASQEYWSGVLKAKSLKNDNQEMLCRYTSGTQGIGTQGAKGAARSPSSKGKEIQMKDYYELRIQELQQAEKIRKLQEELALEEQEMVSIKNKLKAISPGAADPAEEANKPSFKAIVAEQQRKEVAAATSNTQMISLRPEEPKQKERWYVVLNRPKSGIFSEKEKILIEDQPKENVKEAQSQFEAQTIRRIHQIQTNEFKTQDFKKTGQMELARKFTMPKIHKGLPGGPLLQGRNQFSYEEWKRYLLAKEGDDSPLTYIKRNGLKRGVAGPEATNEDKQRLVASGLAKYIYMNHEDQVKFLPGGV